MADEAPATAPEEVELELRDGSVAVVRQLRPSDREELGRAFERLSERSRYERFLSVQDHLTESQLRYLTEIDHHDHEALIAFEPSSRDGVAVARYVKLADDPEAAEAAVVVGDAWHGRGLGTALTRLLADRAREEGVRRFTAILLAENERVLGLFESLGPLRVASRKGGLVEVEIALPDEGIGDHMRGVLRAAAAGDAEQLTPPVGLRQLG